MPTPILPTSTKFSWFRLSEIYDGTGTAQFVPNPEDLVIMPNGTIARVREVDPVTHLSLLEPFTLINPVGPAETTIVNQTTDSFQLYVNTQAIPFAAAVDARLSFNGTAPAYAKVFVGNDLTASGRVISAMINGLGQITSENIPLENVVLPGLQNVTLKTMVPFFVTETLNDDDNVYVVLYTAGGVVDSVFKLVVRNTNFIRTLDASKLVVASIELESAYLNPLNDRLLEIPANMVLQSANLRGKVTYTNGQSQVSSIDGVKFKVLGLDSYVASYPGFTADLVLAYSLGNNEFGTDLNGDPSNRVIMEPYQIRTVEQAGAYSVKLHVVPKWNSGTNRWVLDYYLYSLDREQFYLVTPLVENMVGFTPFNGALYNTLQEIRVAINLEPVAPAFAQYRHVQVFSIQLAEAATNNMTGNYWSVRYSNTSVYGQNYFATVDAADNLRIDCGFGNPTSWLDNLYYTLEPLRSLSNELIAPRPTHVRVKTPAALVRVVPVTQILNAITNVGSGVVQGTTIILEFYRDVGGVIQELAVGALNTKAI